jgi:hypothetical protein
MEPQVIRRCHLEADEFVIVARAAGNYIKPFCRLINKRLPAQLTQIIDQDSPQRKLALSTPVV